MADLEVFPLARPGGINQSAPRPDEEDLEEAKNFALFRERVGLRAPLKLIATIQDDQMTPADVDNILDIVDHEGNLWVASYSSGQQDVYLHSMQVDGSNLTLEAVIWSSVVSKPTVKLTSFEGGTTASPESRLYATDYDQNLDTKYWDGSAIQTLAVDLDADSSAENVQFSLMIPYKFHLWGTGFYESTVTRGEMLRFSEPGLIPATDDAGGTNPREWHTSDHRSVGRRGDKILAVARAGDRLLVFQKRATHSIFGSGGDTWTRQEISSVIGCVGPHAVTSIDERVAYFWASDGPYRTDGSNIQDIGGPIRQLSVSVDAAERDTQVGYSPDDGLVYFIVSPGGEDEYSLGLIFDHRRQRWLKAQWLVGTSTPAEIGAMEFLDSAAAPGPEAAPSSLSATAASDTQIDLTWTNGDVNVNTETHIYRSTSSGFTPNDATNRVATLDAGVASYSDTGLSADTEYFYIARHFRNTSHSSESSEVSDTTWLAEPTGVGLAGLTDGLTVSGTNNAAGADIVIQRKTASGSFSTITTLTTPGGTFSHDDTGLTCDTTYFYRAKATQAGKTDSEWSSTVSRKACDADTVPTAPSGLSATAVGETQIDLSWTDNSDNEDEFRVYRSTTSGTVGAKTLVHTLLPNTTSKSDTGLDSDTDYYYQVTAANDEGESTATSEATDKTDANLDAPSGLVATAVSDSQIDLSWTDNSDDETSFEIEREEGVGGGFSQIDTVGAGVTSYSDTNLSAETTYNYRVRAVAGAETGAYSNEDSATTDSGLPPAAPTSLTATKNGGSPTDTIDLAWTDNANDEDNYEVQRKSGGSFNTIATIAADSTSYQDTGLAAGTTYTYRVRATNANGNSGWSNEDSATTDGASGPPSDPSGLSATPDDNDLNGTEVSAVDLSWTDNATNEDNYIVERCQGSSCTSWSQIASLPAGTESYRDTGVTDDPTDNTIYRYRVKATNSSGDSNYITSGDVTVEPQATSSNVQTSDASDCNGPTPTPKVQVTWENGDVTGIVAQKVQRKKGTGAWSTIRSGGVLTTYTDTDSALDFTSSWSYRIVNDFGSSGENTGEFTSSSDSINLSPPDCGGQF